MDTARCRPRHATGCLRSGLVWRDLLAVLVLAAAVTVLASWLDLNDRLVAWGSEIRWGIGAHLDELPIGLSALAAGLAWYAVRRRREFVTEAAFHAHTAEQLGIAAADAEAARAELERANRRLRDAMETIPEGFVLFDADDRYVLWNRRYEEIYAESADLFAIGRRFEEVLRRGAERGQYPEAAGRIDQWVAERLAMHAASATTHEQAISGGRWLRIHERRTADGGSIGVRIDITDLKRREAEIGEARDRADAANRAKTQFLANMSHELRTPLNAVLGFAEIIASERFGPVGVPAYRGYAADVVIAGRHLLRVVNDILDMAQVEVGRLEFERCPVDVAALAHEACRLLAGAAASAGVGVAVDAGASAPVALADAGRVRQVLLNCLSNAVKFTPREGRVVVAVARDPEEAEVVRITVADTGVGIAAQDLATAMAPFGRVDSAFAPRHGGTGLGLPLSRRFVEEMGGRFELASAVGRGTTVIIRLPAAAAA